MAVAPGRLVRRRALQREIDLAACISAATAVAGLLLDSA
jgi:hypothetical protein